MDICPFTASKIFFKYGYFCRYDYVFINITICNYSVIFTKFIRLDANRKLKAHHFTLKIRVLWCAFCIISTPPL